MTNIEENSDALVAKGAGWMITLRWIGRSLGFLRIMILARLLAPADFGIFALAMIVIGLLEAITSVRPDFILIQDKRLKRVDFDTVWTFMILRGVIVLVFLLLSASYISVWLAAPEVEFVIYVLAIFIFLEGFQNVGIVNLYKNLAFDRIFLLNLIARVCSLIASIVVAFWLGNYWALVAGYGASRVALLLISYLIESYRPKLSLLSWHKVLQFSKWLVLNGLAYTLRLRWASFVIGKWLGADILGFYAVGMRFAQLTGADLVISLRDVIFPAQARMSNDINLVRRLYINSFVIIFLIGAPVSLLVGIVAEPLVLVFLGDQWIETVPIIKILVFYALLHLCTAASSATLLALGKAREMALGQTISTILAIPLIFMGLQTGGVYGVAIAVAISAGLTAVIFSYILIKPLGGIDLNNMISVLRSCFSIVIMVCIMYLLDYDVKIGNEIAKNVFELVFQSTVGGLFYIFTLYLLWRYFGKEGDPEELLFNYMWNITSRCLNINRKQIEKLQ